MLTTRGGTDKGNVKRDRHGDQPSDLLDRQNSYLYAEAGFAVIHSGVVSILSDRLLLHSAHLKEDCPLTAQKHP